MSVSALPARNDALLPLLLFASSLTVMAGATISPSLPGLRSHFASVEHADQLVRLVLTMPGLFIAIAAPISGILADRIGRSRILFAGMLLYGIAGASGLVLENLYAILVGRALLGIAVGMVMTSATALISDHFSGAERQKVLGFQAAAMGYGGVVFLLGGGALAMTGWHGPFAIYLIPLFVLPFALSRITDAPKAVPVPGAVAGVFPAKRALVAYAAAFFGMIIFYLLPVQSPFILEHRGNTSPLIIGMVIASSTLVSATVSLFMAKLAQRFSLKTLLGLAFFIIAAGYSMIALGSGIPSVFAGALISGLGFGLMMPSLTTWLMQAVPPEMRGRASGGYTMMVFLGQFVSPFVHQPLAARFGDSIGIAAIAAACIIIAILLPLAMNAAERAAMPAAARP
jgi:MFS family permease